MSNMKLLLAIKSLIRQNYDRTVIERLLKAWKELSINS